MSPSAVPPIGARLREERQRRGLTIRGLARDIGVSPSLISQVETDKSSPSVSTLYAITTALGVSIEDLFAGRDGGADEAGTAEPAPDGAVDGEPATGGGPRPAGVAPAGADRDGVRAGRPVPGGSLLSAMRGLVGAGAAPGAPAVPHRQRRVGPVVGPGEREVLVLDSGVTWELLGQIPGSHVDFLMITYQPGGTSSSSGLLMRHTGTEYGYVLHGELTLTLGFDKHRLAAGDAVSFDSATPHGYRNDGVEPAIGVWFVVEHP